jgi:hypothetical protein
VHSPEALPEQQEQVAVEQEVLRQQEQQGQ